LFYQAPSVDHAIKNGALKRQNMEMMENSGCNKPPKPGFVSYISCHFLTYVPISIVGGITENNTDQMHDLLQLIRKIGDELVCYMSSLLFQSK
jgi:hypothetical protein